MRALPLMLSLLLAACSTFAQAAETVTPVPSLDISRYAGQWHEIAHLANGNARQGCTRDISTSYTLHDDGGIGIHISCLDQDGNQIASDGRVRLNNRHPGQMELSFAPSWLSWWPFAWHDYWIIDLDPDYTWAVVGEPDHTHFWILARDPWMDRTLFEGLKLRATQMGYDLSNLVVTAPLR